MIKAINLWLQHSSVTCVGGRYRKRRREKQTRLFGETAATSLRPHPCLGPRPRLCAHIPAALGPRVHAAVSAPPSRDSDSRERAFVTSRAQKFPLRGQRQDVTRTKGAPTHKPTPHPYTPHTVPSPTIALGFPFPTWRGERANPQDAPRKVPKAGLFSFRE